MSLETPIPPYNASDPHATFLSASCFEFLLIEVVPLAYRTAAAISRPVITGNSNIGGSGIGNGSSSGARNTAASGAGLSANPNADRKGSASSAASSSTSPSNSGVLAQKGALVAGGNAGVASSMVADSVTAGGAATEDDAQRDVVSKRLEALGYRVGQGIVERFSRDRPRFTDALDVIKFLCKDLWTLLFRKQIDNLKTNHRGVYVLTDNAFRPFSRMSMRTSAEALERAQPFLWFPCGIIRGALASLGIQAVVQAESMELPGAVFQIKTVAAKS